jgi:acetyl-CoA carboxylase carboxyltransferase component
VLDEVIAARRRIDALLDPGSFAEYGRLAQPVTPGLRGPADGLVCGTGTVDGRAIVVLAYDYSVAGGTQGRISHHKLDRVLRLAGEHGWPVVMLLEGGGARAQELDLSSAYAPSFMTLARLSGRVPIVSVVLGPAFAGHATLAGLSDVVVAVRGASMGMAGPPLVAASTGRQVTAQEIGAIEFHESAGSVDVVVDDEPEALSAVRRYLTFTEPGIAPAGPAADQLALRSIVPESPRRAYDIRKVIAVLADPGSVFELRPRFARSAVTALARLHGHRIGFAANQPMVLGGAIDSSASDKLARFIALCDTLAIPLVFLVDTPGFMVGEAVERTALVRHSSRIAFALAAARVPILTVVLRKAYGLAYYLLGSPATDPALLVEWPLAEYGGMGLEGAGRILGQDDVDGLRKRHGADAAAAKFVVDDLIEPEETRDTLARTLSHLDQPPPRDRPLDPW